MKKDRIDVSDKTAISMPMRNLIGIISAVAVGVYAFFGIQETLNKHSTTLELMEKDLNQNTEFRIKYPRGELGQSSGEAELFMHMEHMSGLIDGMNAELTGMRNNAVNIDFLIKQVEKMSKDIEKLKDKQRTFANGNGAH